MIRYCDPNSPVIQLDRTILDGERTLPHENEAQAPNSIYPAGYRNNTFKPGDEVTVTINPVTNGRPYGRIDSVVLADGRRLGGEGPGRGRGRGAANP